MLAGSFSGGGRPVPCPNDVVVGGKGVGDDTARLLRARDKLQRRGTGRLVFPSLMRLRQPFDIEPPTGPLEYGNGCSYSFIGADGNSNAVIWDPLPEYLDADAFTLRSREGQVWHGGHIANLIITAEGTAATGAGICLRGTLAVACHQVRVRAFGAGVGWRLTDYAQDTRLFGCAGDTCGEGWLFDRANNTTLVACDANQCYVAGIRVNDVAVLGWHGGLSQGNATHAVRISPRIDGAVTSVLFQNLYMELGPDCEAGYRFDTGAATSVEMNVGRITNAFNLDTFVHFDMETPVYDFGISRPRIYPGGSQKVLRVASEHTHGEVVSELMLNTSRNDIAAGARIEWRGGGVRQRARLTQAQIDGLYAQEGDEVYNLTTHAPQYYNGTEWV